jgi:hypothetical protein
MNKTIQEQATHFATLIDKCGVDWTPENVLKCIGFAKQAMQAGEVSVEAYYKAKTILISRLECATLWMN